MAWLAPFEPIGYIGCAASPSSVVRVVDHVVSGSRSHIGYTQMSSVAPMRPRRSTSCEREPLEVGRQLVAIVSLVHETGRGGGVPAGAVRSTIAQFVRRLLPVRPGATG